MTESDKRKGYREFWLQTDNKDIQTFEYFATETECYDDDIHVIDIQAAEDLAAALAELEHHVYDYGIEQESIVTAMACEKAKQALAKYRGTE